MRNARSWACLALEGASPPDTLTQLQRGRPKNTGIVGDAAGDELVIRREVLNTLCRLNLELSRRWPHWEATGTGFRS